MLSGLRKGDNEEFTVQQNPANKSQHNTLYSLARTLSRGKSGKSGYTRQAVARIPREF
jgi:hypothetical protein